MKSSFILLALMLTCIVHLNEGKRTSTGRRTSSGSTSYSNTRSRVATQAPKYTSKPHSSGTSYSSGSNTQSKPSYGWKDNAHGPPPAYSPSNTAGGAKTNMREPPPAYQPQSHASYPSNTHQQSSISRIATQKPLSSNNQRPIGTQTQRPLQASYPKQQYPVNSGIPANARPVNQLPPGATLVHLPQSNSGYYGAGGGYRPQPLPGNYHPPANAVPAYYSPAAVQPGYYPPGSFPKQSSGPGFGTGLGLGIAGGALGGALLHGALSSSGGHRNNYNDNSGGMGRETIIRETTIINNTNTITNNGVPVSGDSGVPLAPINHYDNQQQPGQSMNTPNMGPMNPPLIHSPNQQNPSDPNVPLAPLAPLNNYDSNATMNTAPQPAMYCLEKNVTDPNDATKMITTTECYIVPEEPPNPNNAQNTNQQFNAGSSQPTSHTESYSNTQKTSSVTMSETARIKQSGAIGKEISLISLFTPILTILVAFFLQ